MLLLLMMGEINLKGNIEHKDCDVVTNPGGKHATHHFGGSSREGDSYQVEKYSNVLEKILVIIISIFAMIIILAIVIIINSS